MQQPDHQARSLRAFAPALVLLVISFVINYVDRGNLSIAAPLLSVELDLSPARLGVLLSVFFWTYTLMQFVMGWLVDHFDVNRILAAGFLLWSLATATTGLVRGFVLLLAMRLILGIGESVAMPAGSKILARCLPEHHRGFAGVAHSLGSDSSACCGFLPGSSGCRATDAPKRTFVLRPLASWKYWRNVRS